MSRLRLFVIRDGLRSYAPLFLLALMAFFLSVQDGRATLLTFAWDEVDGAAGYKLYYGKASRHYTRAVDVGNVSEYTLDVAEGPAYYFALVAYDSSRLESDFSEEVVYDGEPCSYAISPVSTFIGSQGGTGSVTVTAPARCPWSASSGASWIRIVSGGAGKGSKKVAYYVQSNTGPSRFAASTIAGQVFTLTQDTAGYFVAASADTGGSIAPAGKVAVPSGSDLTFIVTSGAGYKIGSVFVDGRSLGAIDSYTFAGVNSNHSIRAVFAPLLYHLTIAATGSGRGGVSTRPAGTLFRAGTTVSVTARPSANSFFAGWSGACSGDGPLCRVAIAGDTSVSARFGRLYRITASHGPGGSISPDGPLKVREGETFSFTITPKSGYRVLDVMVDGVSIGPVTSYTFTGVTADHSITARFGK